MLAINIRLPYTHDPKTIMSDTPRTFIYLLKHTELAVRGCVEVALEQFDLTPNQFLMLLRLSHKEGQSVPAGSCLRAQPASASSSRGSSWRI